MYSEISRLNQTGMLINVMGRGLKTPFTINSVLLGGGGGGGFRKLNKKKINWECGFLD